MYSMSEAFYSIKREFTNIENAVALYSLSQALGVFHGLS